MGKKERFQPLLGVRLESLYRDPVVLMFTSPSLFSPTQSVGGGSVMDTAKVANLSAIALS